MQTPIFYKETESTEWSSFEDFISYANKHFNWVVLRNFEYLPDNFFGNDKDVDILCNDFPNFIQSMKLKKRSYGTAAYFTTIDFKIVHFDVRFLGDGYYDKLWEYQILSNKVYTDKGVPRPDDLNYFYSLLYHAKIQKNFFNPNYMKRILALSKIIGEKKIKLEDLDNDSYLANLLSLFMIKNQYYYTSPLDINVGKNKRFLRKMSKVVLKGEISNITGKVRFISILLKVLVFITPVYLRKLLKKYFK